MMDVVLNLHALVQDRSDYVEDSFMRPYSVIRLIYEIQCDS
jgi:hypothetical protein